MYDKLDRASFFGPAQAFRAFPELENRITTPSLAKRGLNSVFRHASGSLMWILLLCCAAISGCGYYAANSQTSGSSPNGSTSPVLSALSCVSASMSGSGSDACTVTLSAAAPTGGLSVSLSSSDNAVTVPASVLVQASATTADFTATVSSVNSSKDVTLAAANQKSSKTFHIKLKGGGTATLSLSTTSLAFGDVAVNTAATQSLTLSSTATAAVTISSATLTGTGFSISGMTFPVTLNPGQAATLTVQFDPAAAGTVSGQLSIVSDSPTNPTAVIALSGTGVTAGGTVPTLSISATSVAFGNVTVNKSTTQSLTLSSTGTASVTISTATVTGAGFSVSGITLPVTLNPGQAATLTVQFDPATAGTVSGQLSIVSDSSTNPTAVIALNGTGVTAGGTVPTLSINATSVAFGNVTVNTSATQSLTLSSTGTASVTISTATVTGAGFSISGITFPLTLNPGQTATLYVQFDPTTTGTAAGQLTITSNSSSNLTAQITLSGGGVAVSHQVDLSWNAPTSSPDPVAGYNVYRAPAGTSSYQLLNSSADTITTYLDTTVQSGLGYDYVVKSVDASGVESPPSNAITVNIP